MAGAASVACLLVLLTTQSTGWGQELVSVDARTGRQLPVRSRRARSRQLAATSINAVGAQARRIKCAIQSLAGGISPDGGGCPVVKVVNGVPSGFPNPQFSKTGAQYNENNAGGITQMDPKAVHDDALTIIVISCAPSIFYFSLFLTKTFIQAGRLRECSTIVLMQLATLSAGQSLTGQGMFAKSMVMSPKLVFVFLSLSSSIFVFILPGAFVKLTRTKKRQAGSTGGL